MAKDISIYKMANDEIKGEGADAAAKKGRRYVKNIFDRIGVDVNKLKKMGRSDSDTGEIKPGKVRDNLKVTDELESSFRDRLKNDDFPTQYEMDDFEKAIKDIPGILTENNMATSRTVRDLKGFFEANKDMVMSDKVKEGYNKKINELAGVMEEIAKIAKEYSETYSNSIIKMCTFNPFDIGERQRHLLMVARVCENYHSDKSDKFNEADLIIIRFLRLEDELDRAIKRARADLFIMSHMQKN